MYFFRNLCAFNNQFSSLDDNYLDSYNREGENIGYEVISVCRAVKPDIVVHRAKFSEITYHSITRAIANLQQPDKNVSDAVDVRQELDLRIGAAFTRFQTLRLKQVFPETLGKPQPLLPRFSLQHHHLHGGEISTLVTKIVFLVSIRDGLVSLHDVKNSTGCCNF